MAILKYVTAVLSGITLLAAGPAFALAVSTGATGNVNVDATVASTTDVNVGVTGNANASGGNSASTGSSSDDMTATNASGNAGMNADLSVPLVVTRADVDNNTVEATNVSAGSVQTKADLSGYVASQIQSDQDITAVDTASDHVAVTYPEHAELFGFIPVTINTTATTDASGTVTITQPWWSFLAATDQSALQGSVQASVTNVLGANASSTTELSASQQAQLVTAIKDALAASANTNANASANANASGSVSY